MVNRTFKKLVVRKTHLILDIVSMTFERRNALKPEMDCERLLQAPVC